MTSHARKKFLALTSGTEKAKVDEIDKPKIAHNKSDVGLGSKFYEAIYNTKPKPFNLLDYMPENTAYPASSTYTSGNLRQSLETIRRNLSLNPQVPMLYILFPDMTLCVGVDLYYVDVEAASPMIISDLSGKTYSVRGPENMKVNMTIAETTQNRHVFTTRFQERLMYNDYTKIVAVNSGKTMFSVVIDTISLDAADTRPSVINASGIVVKDMSNFGKGVS